ncbi:hypothetical protein PUN28_018643 [Cardiocondyla obscurior]|uniref:Secreted protein n=1 Tax=Cardiocondyla obscurior TaxID=286306 RepID=A0AAW2EJ09_9HYME
MAMSCFLYVPTRSSLCSCHFSQAYSAGFIPIDNAVRLWNWRQLSPTRSRQKATEVDRSSPQREPETVRANPRRYYKWEVARRKTENDAAGEQGSCARKRKRRFSFHSRRTGSFFFNPLN